MRWLCTIQNYRLTTIMDETLLKKASKNITRVFFRHFKVFEMWNSWNVRIDSNSWRFQKLKASSLNQFIANSLFHCLWVFRCFLRLQKLHVCYFQQQMAARDKVWWLIVLPSTNSIKIYPWFNLPLYQDLWRHLRKIFSC